ncbi:MAG: trypsin-like peptidase domain-containing protein [Candidatus Kerfeldbacteria bacterium]|nr:trypsin-like peptidase domain-containing protein [Candidatus Kerfeldbacteria bacterium]
MEEQSTLHSTSSKKPKRHRVSFFIALSFIVGGIAGGISGALVGGGAEIWQDILSNTPASSTIERSSNRTTQVIDASEATIDVINKMNPSVVSVISTKEFQQYREEPLFGPFYRRVPNGTTERQVGGGSGFIISKDGMILTNKHVVSDTTVNYTVILNDGREFSAKIVDVDPLNDLAVIDIDASDLPVAAIGDSDQLQVGETVLAFGNALGEYSNSVTRGIVSGLNRQIVAGDFSGSETLENVIQTDAAINPGNSGGPLVNLAGEVVGMNTAIDAQGQSIGFAIPINEAVFVIESIEKYGRIARGVLGVRYTMLTPEMAEQQNLSVDHGALVTSGAAGTPAVIPGSAAEAAGVKEGDIITHIDGTEISDEHPLSSLIRKKKIGDTIELTIQRGSDDLKLQATLQEYGVKSS